VFKVSEMNYKKLNIIICGFQIIESYYGNMPTKEDFLKETNNEIFSVL
jgi:hypothetical protein